jgi:hypothetical protein
VASAARADRGSLEGALLARVGWLDLTVQRDDVPT